MMDYKKAYYSLIEKLKEAKEDADVCDERYCCVIDGLIQEPEESERIRKAISQCVEDMRGQFEKLYNVHHKDAIAWLEKQGEQEQLYIRFGEIPTDEKSKIYQGEIEVGTENGVSVYPAFKTDEGDIVLGLNLPITKTTLHTQQHLLEYDDRPCYLVKGDYVGKDTDGQPLINNVSIIKKIDSYRVKEEKQGQKDPCKDCKHPMLNCYNFPCLKKQEYQGKTALEAIHEQNPDNANKVEVKPKFKVGDWIIRSAEGFKHNTYLVTEVKDYYICEELKGRRVTFTFNDVNKNFKLWDISDAKDGDVLFIEVDGSICIFKKLEVNSLYSYIISDGKLLVEDSHYYYETSDNIHPATKKQKDFLFKRMEEEGYKWDDEHKELKKIETINIPFNAKDSELMEATYFIPKGFHADIEDNKVIIKKDDQKSILSKEDNTKLRQIEYACMKFFGGDCSHINWLRKFTKPQTTWKPTEEQLYWLKYTADSTSDTEKGNAVEAVLKELYEQLKKL